jgi:predicted  nucleic acid-binding Zn-ribbon protein
MSTTPTVEISWGELVDRLTILEIKERRLNAPDAVANVRRELATLNKVLNRLKPLDGFAALKQGLTAVNENLWEIEDKIRAKEAASSFDQEFIDLARSVYFNNDKRAALKREINLLLKSDLIEEKQYTAYEV